MPTQMRTKHLSQKDLRLDDAELADRLRLVALLARDLDGTPAGWSGLASLFELDAAAVAYVRKNPSHFVW
jgi:hypothetical protein